MNREPKDRSVNKAKQVRNSYKRVSMEALYQFYPHKTMEVKEGTVPIPYVAKEEMSTHEWKLTYAQWKAICLCYFKYVIRYLLQGYTYQIPWGLGYFTLMKYRLPTRDYIRVKKEMEANPEMKPPGFRKLYDRALDGYCIKLQWDKRRRTSNRFAFKEYYIVNIVYTTYLGIYRAFVKDRGMLYRLRNQRMPDE